MIQQHTDVALAPGGHLADTVAERLLVAVAPATGRFRPRADLPERLPAGELLGHVTGGRGRADAVHCPAPAAMRDLLARPGQLVARGQGLAWLERIEAE